MSGRVMMSKNSFLEGFKVATDVKQCERKKMFLGDISTRKSQRRMFWDEIKKGPECLCFVINPLYCIAAFISPPQIKVNVILSFRFL